MIILRLNVVTVDVCPHLNSAYVVMMMIVRMVNVKTAHVAPVLTASKMGMKEVWIVGVQLARRVPANSALTVWGHTLAVKTIFVSTTVPEVAIRQGHAGEQL